MIPALIEEELKKEKSRQEERLYVFDDEELSPKNEPEENDDKSTDVNFEIEPTPS